MPSRPVSRHAILGVIAVVTVLAVGCGSGAPAPTSPSAAASVAAPSYFPIGNPAPVSPRPTVQPSPVASAVEPTPAATGLADLPRHGRIELPAFSFAITLPANWYRIDLTQQDLETFFQAGAKNLGPGVSAQLSSQIAQLAASRIPLFALRFPDGRAGVGTNLNVASLPTLGLDLDTLEKLNVAQLGSALGAGVKINHSHVRLPAGDAVRFSYTVASPGATAGNAAILQYLLVGKSTQLILSCTSPGSTTGIAAECETIAKSLQFLA